MADCIFNGTTKRPPLGLAEVTITMEDPELAEAARFVMESSASDPAADSESLITENSETCGSADTTTEILSLDPAQPSETKEAAADGSASVLTEPGGKIKRRKKQADKPVLAIKPGEVVISRRLYRSGQSEYLINGRVG